MDSSQTIAPRTKPGFSPSKLEGLEACPCFEFKPFENTPGEETAAERGTRLHKAVQFETVTDCRDEEEREQVESCIAFTRNLAEGSAETLKEWRLEIPGLVRGIADAVICWPKKAAVLDYKFIRTDSVSDPETNLQLACYASALFSVNGEWEEVHCHIFAPGIHFAPPPKVYRREDLPRILSRIKAVIDEAGDPFKTPRAGEQCKRCLHASRCPALGNVAVTVGKKLGCEIALPENLTAQALTTPEVRGTIQGLSDFLSEWCEEIKKSNTGALKAGMDIPGLMLAKRSGSLKVADAASLISRITTGGIAKLCDVLPLVKISVADLSTLYKTHLGCTAEEARDRLVQDTEEFLERGPDIYFLGRRKNKKGKNDILKPLLDI